MAAAGVTTIPNDPLKSQSTVQIPGAPTSRSGPIFFRYHSLNQHANYCFGLREVARRVLVHAPLALFGARAQIRAV